MNPLRVLVVEDEAVLAMFVESAVEDAGHIVAAYASNITDAMALAATGDFDVALLDLNLNGQKAHAVAMTLATRGKRFAFLTGYGDHGVLSKFEEAPVLTKPFTEREVAEVLEKLSAL